MTALIFISPTAKTTIDMKRIILMLSVVFVSLISNGQMFYGHNRISSVPSIYGLLYNGYAVIDANFAPTGWHVPLKSEWATLSTYLGGNSISGGKLKETGTTHWNSPNDGATNETGFTALPGGFRADDGVFYSIGDNGLFWAYDNTEACYLGMDKSNPYVSFTFTYAILGISVRLIKDDSTDPGTMTDYDGNSYNTVKIGDQVWISSNWKCKHLKNGTSINQVTGGGAWIGLTSGAWCYYDNDPLNE